MRLLYVSSDVSAIHLNLLNALEKNDIHSTLCTYTTSSNSKEPLQTNETWFYRSNNPFRGPILYLYRLLQVAKFYLQKTESTKINVTHGNMLFGDGFICRYLYKHASIPYVVSVRNTDMNLWFLWKLPWIRQAGIKNLEQSKRIVFLSNPYKRMLLNRLPETIRTQIESKCVVVPNGIDDFWFENREKRTRSIQSEIVFITAGRVEDNKNQLTTALAINLYRKKHNIPVRYLIVGDCENMEMQNALKTFDFVELLPYQKKEELIYSLRRSDIYIMPSHTETFGLVYAEALTQGLPVIYTSGQGFDEQFAEGEVGYAVDSRSKESICKGIEQTVANYDEISKNAYCLCERFRWQTVSSNLKEIYNATLGNS